jgi:peroxiredoxin
MKMLVRITLACAMLFNLASPVQAGKFSDPKIGQIAPDATLYLVKGGKVKLSDLRGQVVVINFWATWCVPCRQELPTLDAYYRAQRKHGLRVFSATTESSVPQYTLRALFDVLAIEPVRHLRGPYGPIDDAVPTNFIIDRAGRVRYARAGAFDLDDLNRELVPLLKEPAPSAAAGT